MAAARAPVVPLAWGSERGTGVCWKPEMLVPWPGRAGLTHGARFVL